MMKLRHSAAGTVLILMVLSLGHPLAGRSAEKSEKKEGFTTNTTHQAACQQQLNIIHGAIQEYLERNQHLPRWLSELVPDYIHDPKMLVCPYVDSTGSLSKWREGFVNYPVFGDPAQCSYAYEFCTIPIPKIPDFTCRDYKQRQMAMIGFSVPIVRCFAHRPILNLGFDGSIYLSRSEWEDNFVISPKHEAAFHNVWLLTFQKRSLNEIVLELVEPRKPEANPRLLDLSGYYNASLLHLSQLDLSGKLLTAYPEDILKIEGIEFDVRGLVHLTGRNFPIEFPEKVEN